MVELKVTDPAAVEYSGSEVATMVVMSLSQLIGRDDASIIARLVTGAR